ncbi:TetR/AcrR family transcriptional regulator [Antrihabitans sp. YC2-6]|uniref:TetR/AcrR family transcriptional regulator n=1 Tax=Antrihabitans sp. YC2-6 TaxID=2799498 RepID=UPI0018F7BFD1|nr:TetR/AcrR family transcriptional regulator [Antrihabitans sp. YC2-6]MBJ8345738.1 TetR/AcrR family transcriptional regulator [Antrihabitans sp. YC2-6]
MPRPRIHDLDAVLDAAELLAVQSGPASVTIRGVAATTGMSNGAIYHNFGSRAELLGRTWLRAATRFLDGQKILVEEALATAGPVDAVVAAADAPAVLSEQFPTSAALLLKVRRSDFLGDDVPTDIATAIAGTDKQLVDLMIRLSSNLWDRRDGHAVDVITTCIVDLPTSVLLQRDRLHNPVAREHLRAAVRAVLAVGPPPRQKSK